MSCVCCSRLFASHWTIQRGSSDRICCFFSLLVRLENSADNISMIKLSLVANIMWSNAIHFFLFARHFIRSLPFVVQFCCGLCLAVRFGCQCNETQIFFLWKLAIKTGQMLIPLRFTITSKTTKRKSKSINERIQPNGSRSDAMIFNSVLESRRFCFWRNLRKNIERK